MTSKSFYAARTCHGLKMNKRALPESSRSAIVHVVSLQGSNTAPYTPRGQHAAVNSSERRADTRRTKATTATTHTHAPAGRASNSHRLAATPARPAGRGLVLHLRRRQRSALPARKRHLSNRGFVSDGVVKSHWRCAVVCNAVDDIVLKFRLVLLLN